MMKETKRAKENKEKLKKKKQKQNNMTTNDRNTLNSTSARSLRKGIGEASGCFFFKDFMMWDLGGIFVASWDRLLRHEGAWRALAGSLGGNVGAQVCPKKF